MVGIKPPSQQDLRAFFCPFHFQKTYPETANYGKIAFSGECHSKEQITNQTEASQGHAYQHNSYLFYGGCIKLQVRLYRTLVER